MIDARVIAYFLLGMSIGIAVVKYTLTQDAEVPAYYSCMNNCYFKNLGSDNKQKICFESCQLLSEKKND